jgi:signal transduction histidine kinase
MKLRGRFTLALALAALVPITIAAVVTTRVIANSYHSDYAATRASVERTLVRERDRLLDEVDVAARALASHDHTFVGYILRALVKTSGDLDYLTHRWIQEHEHEATRGLSLDVLLVTGPDDVVLAAPHDRPLTSLPEPLVRERAIATRGKPYFTREQIMEEATAHAEGPAIATVLVAEAARQSERDQSYAVSLWAGKRVGERLLTAARSPGRFEVDARIVAAGGELIIPPARPDSWDRLAKDPPIRTPLVGPDGAPIAYVEAAVSDGAIDAVLWNVTLMAAAVALGALGIVVVIGLFVAKRTARDLERLVEGSHAAARGDLDHRVPVRSNDEVGAVASAFNLMMEDLRTAKERLVIAERIAAWQDIARRLAHEIKNPLTPIQMAMDTLKKSWKKQHPQLDEIVEESTTTVLQEADRLKHIVTEFSDFARMPKPELVRVDLNEIVRAAVAMYQGAVAIDTVLDDRLPQLDADKGQMQQIVINLLENARDAIGEGTPELDRASSPRSGEPAGRGGLIAVTTRLGDAGDRALLVVEDNGPGVPAELKGKIFSPYFTTKHAKGGTGLGLAIVHRIVSDHGGRIMIGDAPGGGARFAIELPLRDGMALLASRI